MSNTMKPFLEPRSVALIGVPRANGPEAYNTLENMLNAGFSGSVYPINPKADEVLGTRVYPSVLDIAGVSTFRTHRFDSFGNIVPRHVRHSHVADYRIMSTFSKDLRRRVTITNFRHIVPQVLKHEADDVNDVRIIVDY